MSGTCCAVMPLQDTPFIPTTTSPGRAKRERAALVGVKAGMKKTFEERGVQLTMGDGEGDGGGEGGRGGEGEGKSPLQTTPN